MLLFLIFVIVTNCINVDVIEQPVEEIENRFMIGQQFALYPILIASWSQKAFNVFKLSCYPFSYPVRRFLTAILSTANCPALTTLIFL